MKTYSAKTNARAADAVLTAAVDAALGLLRPAVFLDRAVEDSDLVVSLLPRIESEILLSAARSAELLLERAR